MAIFKSRRWKVRCFIDEDEPEIVLARESEIRTIKVRTAEFTQGKWTVTTIDGTKFTLPHEKKRVKLLKDADIITDFRDGYSGPFYEEVLEDYSNLNLRSAEYRLAYLKRRFFRQRLFISSPIKQLWKEEGKYNVLTKSGSHYVFPIKD